MGKKHRKHKKNKEKNTDSHTSKIVEIHMTQMKTRIIQSVNSLEHPTLIIPICLDDGSSEEEELHVNTLRTLREKGNDQFVGLINDEINRHQGFSANNIDLICELFGRKLKNIPAKIYISSHSSLSYIDHKNSYEIYSILEPLFKVFNIKSVTLDACNTADSFEEASREKFKRKWETIKDNKTNDIDLADGMLDRLTLGANNFAKRLSICFLEFGHSGIEVKGFRGDVYHEKNRQLRSRRGYGRTLTLFNGYQETKIKSSEGRIIYKDGKCIESNAKTKDFIFDSSDKEHNMPYVYKP